MAERGSPGDEKKPSAGSETDQGAHEVPGGRRSARMVSLQDVGGATRRVHRPDLCWDLQSSGGGLLGRPEEGHLCLT